jgi:glutamyl-tRNA reductase
VACEAVALSTCNRTELYTTGIAVKTRKPALVNILLKSVSHDGSSAEEEDFYAKEGLMAAEHLLAVAAGLDSMVVGETEIQTSEVSQISEVLPTFME